MVSEPSDCRNLPIPCGFIVISVAHFRSARLLPAIYRSRNDRSFKLSRVPGSISSFVLYNGHSRSEVQVEAVLH